MKIEIHSTTMMDGDKVTDVDILTNTRPGVNPRCILTFNDRETAVDFVNKMATLCGEFGIFTDVEVTNK